jgi:AraC-like DNA-binding protein
MLKIALVCYDRPAVIPLQRPFAILLITKGEGLIRVGADCVSIQSGRVFLFRQEHKAYLQEGTLIGHLVEFQKVLLDYYLLQNINHRNRGLFDFGLSMAYSDIKLHTLFFLMSLIGQLVDELEQRSDVSIFQHYLFLFLWHTNRHIAEMNVRMSEQERVMKKAMLLIEEHYIKHRDTFFYADKLGLSDRRLNKLARATTGKLFFDVLNDRVMAEADLLLRTDLPIKDIAYRLGFGSYNHFDYFCMKYLKMSAASFRRLLGEGG